MPVPYLGANQYFLGIPMRDLTDEEWAAIDIGMQTVMLDSGLYNDGSRGLRAASRAKPTAKHKATEKE